MYLENSKTLLNISKSPSAPDSEEIVITVVISPYNFLNSRIYGSLLPDFMLSALSVAIYGMFLAIIIPPSKKSRPVLGVVVASMAVSTIFAVTPVLKQVSSGFMIIITTLLVAGLAAYFCPVEEKEEAAHES